MSYHLKEVDYTTVERIRKRMMVLPDTYTLFRKTVFSRKRRIQDVMHAFLTWYVANPDADAELANLGKSK